ncbi:hypothetical protein F3S07_00595 [Vibrio alginolyticus]|uniref:DUF3265 domain-containing protein n=3 Tax=Vibrio TaxID=662 RepID=A0AAX1XSX5_9VIBR|nr:hypothetical protein AL537_05120 [Vibrio diabolicus]AVF67279.1 hypothetical protein AL541_24820 [Vibrio alginolyticus]EAS76457.1 hypothetical protein V12G01_10983 [Vibrio alginolyticus 12G01]MPS38955.1 hypothetical protein [Vibrio sp. VGrn 2]NAW53603.1 hypothetical protein [Vibrio sp. V41_P2S12T139]NAW92924.1 hypothetical protein [Vibrio sp. V42_P2S4T144]NKJ69247.1 hypothetical protein [Vibrio chemaguriensis]NNN41824.1 hypothetical protein [Vibrio sp. 2-2(2)]NNN51712.1 hypothetical prote
MRVGIDHRYSLCFMVGFVFEVYLSVSAGSFSVFFITFFQIVTRNMHQE